MTKTPSATQIARLFLRGLAQRRQAQLEVGHPDPMPQATVENITGARARFEDMGHVDLALCCTTCIRILRWDMTLKGKQP